MKLASTTAAASVLFALSITVPQWAAASIVDGTYAGSYSKCSQGITGIISSFLTSDKGKAKIVSAIYDIPGQSENVPTVIFEWTGTYNADNHTFNMSDYRILGASNGYSVGPIKGTYTADGKKVTWTLCGQAFTQTRLSTSPKQVP